ncbi:hypothetical protein Ac2012v2_000168 [Leucoagaricus gongylophorus]
MPEDGMDAKTCFRMQQEEFEVLESIYPECIASQMSDDGLLALEIPIEFNDTRLVKIVPQVLSSSTISSPRIPYHLSSSDLVSSCYTFMAI